MMRQVVGPMILSPLEGCSVGLFTGIDDLQEDRGCMPKKCDVYGIILHVVS